MDLTAAQPILTKGKITNKTCKNSSIECNHKRHRKIEKRHLSRLLTTQFLSLPHFLFELRIAIYTLKKILNVLIIV